MIHTILCQTVVLKKQFYQRMKQAERCDAHARNVRNSFGNCISLAATLCKQR